MTQRSLQDIDYPLFPWIYIHPEKSININMNRLDSQFLRYIRLDILVKRIIL